MIVDLLLGTVLAPGLQKPGIGPVGGQFCQFIYFNIIGCVLCRYLKVLLLHEANLGY
jgi:hypothetical protein